MEHCKFRRWISDNHRRIGSSSIPRSAYRYPWTDTDWTSTQSGSAYNSFPASLRETATAFHYLYPRKGLLHTPDISYTNLGKIDSSGIYFNDCTLTYVHLTGRPRIYPAFQVSVSSWEDTCTLSCHIAGDTIQIAAAQRILAHMTAFLQQYAESKTA